MLPFFWEKGGGVAPGKKEEKLGKQNRRLLWKKQCDDITQTTYTH